jgi:hypothetical protein
MILLLLLAQSLMAAELTVGPTGDYATIGEAIAASDTYDDIIVGPGTYHEAIWLTRNVEIYPRDGLGSVIIDGSGAVGNVLTQYNGSVRGLVIINAPGQAVDLRGSLAVFEQSTVLAPGGVGVGASTSTPRITEVAVYDAGGDAFSFSGGSPVVQRCLAVDPARSGFAIATPGSYSNLVAIGGQHGFDLSAQVTLQHPAALDSAASGLITSQASAVSNGLFTDNALVASCGGSELELAWSLLYDSADSQDCPTTPYHDNLVGNPRLETWSSGARPPLVDLSPRDSSPMLDAGDGTDSDGSRADMGPFGGADGAWTDADGDGVPLHFDCDDANPAVHLHAGEPHDGVDNDCDGAIDEGEDPEDTGPDTAPPEDTGLDERDLDGDGWSVADGDCQDHNRATWPGAVEIADGADNDCDGVADDDLWFSDDDGDGYAEGNGDCDDHDPSRSPGQPEQGEDGVDHNCDGVADGVTTADRDGDGYTVGQGDCDDTRAEVHPDAPDSLDGVDTDCDGLTDDDGLAADDDGDGVTVAQLDCDDQDISISSTSPELADDGIDQDCDGVDLYDVDADGHPSPAAGGGDCDDGNDTVHPDADELCDGLDNDCDGKIDELCGDGELDGPPRDPWTPGIHGGCNGSCSSAPGANPGIVVLLAMTALACCRRRYPEEPIA